MNTNSQAQVNLTTLTSSEDNSANDYSGNRFFSGRGGWNLGRSNCDGRGSGRGSGRSRFADVQCQICYKFGHVVSYCYHRLEENYVPTLPPPASLASTQSTSASNAQTSLQVQYAQPIQYVLASPQ